MSAAELRRRFIVLVFPALLSSVYAIAQAQDTQPATAQQQPETDLGQADEPAAGTSDGQAVDSEDPSAGDTAQGVDAEDGAPPFDIDTLVERMKNTDAIGVISKLSLKNKVDDLLERADEIKQKQASGDVASHTSALREEFEGLILKTIALLNKGEDYTLAEDIYLAREALWKSIMENKA